jgi:pyridoxal phosphate enzyme (YggS family)
MTGLAEVTSRIHVEATAAGRDSHAIRLIAVSKMKSITDIERIYDAGQRDFGENYVDELLEKSTKLACLPEVRWVYIGQLQSNKIQRLVRQCHEIQTIASIKHARYVQRYALEEKKSRFPVWIHVNAASEDQKAGTSAAEVPGLAAFISTECPNLELQGLMAIPPNSYSDDVCNDVPQLYRDLRILANSVGLGKLSLGMSADLRLAVQAGSDCIRIGTAIFGQR